MRFQFTEDRIENLDDDIRKGVTLEVPPNAANKERRFWLKGMPSAWENAWEQFDRYLP